MSPEKILTELELDFVVEAAQDRDLGVNEKLEATAAYKPNLTDLASLYTILTKTNRTTVLEFGVGWSTLIFAATLKKLQSDIGDLSNYRRNNPYECHSVDDVEEYIKIAQKRIPKTLEAHTNVLFSPAEMVLWNGRIATQYETLPHINPDFIYIDAPDQFDIKKDINGWSTRHKDMMPMMCDVLKIEHFLTPKTIIVVDGRAANARFIKANLERNWEYKYDEARDQHFFVLEEEPLGKYSKAIIEDVYYKEGKWSIADL